MDYQLRTMATKTIAWTTGSGNITLTYTGQGNGSISVSSSENDSFDDRSQSFNIVTTNGSPEQAVSILVKQKGKTYPVGEVFNFDYTGSVQQITLPKGKYKLQCWGAQGGTSYALSSAVGSKGGYSEGILTLSETTILYIFVGGQGSRGSSTSLVNGGWNGGGASVGYSSYNSGDTDGESYPACGGGATDISTVTSSMSYSGGRTNRSSASLLARCIVAGGGAGGSYRRTEVTTSDTTTSDIKTTTVPYSSATSTRLNFWQRTTVSGLPVGETVYFRFNETPASYTIQFANSSNTVLSTLTNESSGVVPSGAAKIVYSLFYNISAGYTSSDTITATVYTKETTSSTSSSTGKSSATQQGGGTSGKGQYPGTQTSAGSGGAFGLGANQSSSNYRYCAGGGGGGWYGGGTGKSDSSTSYVNYSGGGSGFVNTAANAASRPSGYTGLQLDSGTTKDGSTSFESTSGGTETGHSGNGYARITVLE